MGGRREVRTNSNKWRETRHLAGGDHRRNRLQHSTGCVERESADRSAVSEKILASDRDHGTTGYRTSHRRYRQRHRNRYNRKKRTSMRDVPYLEGQKSKKKEKVMGP